VSRKKNGLIISHDSVIPTVPTRLPWAMHNADGSVSQVGFEGTTQKHPKPYAGGYKIDLGLNGPFREDPADGYIQTLGNTSQTAAGLVQTLNAGQTNTTIDLPGMGPVFAFSKILLGLGIVNAAPAPGNNRVGLQLSNNRVAYTVDTAVFRSGDWKAGQSINGGGWTAAGSAGGVAIADVGDIDYIVLDLTSGLSSAFAQSYSISIGEEGNLVPFQAYGSTFSTLFIRNDIPDTYDLTLRAFFAGGSDFIVTYKYLMIFPQPTLSVAD